MKFLCLMPMMIFAASATAARLPLEPFVVDGHNLATRDHADGLYEELAAGAVVSVLVKTPGLDEREAAVRGDWRGILSVDLYGKLDGEPGRAILELLDPMTGEVIASQMSEITHPLSTPASTDPEDLEAIGNELEPTPTPHPPGLPGGHFPAERIWVELPAEIMAVAEGATLGLRLRNSQGAALAIGQPHYSRVHTRPSGQLFGRSNGGLGPDKLGAGLLGFDAITEHEDTVLTVLEPRPRSAASRARLRAGDAIVAIGGQPLPVNCVEPGWRWFHQSHEAVIGRRTEAALAAGARTLPVSVMRDGKIEQLEFPLSRTRPFTTLDPATDPEAAEMLRDMIAFLVKTQNDDGSWSGCMIRTCLSALALMATEDGRHRPRVRRAVNWAQERFKTPDNFGNLGFWNAGFAGILYGEWHLAQGDRSAVRHIEELLVWAAAGSHTSSWGVPALGHGPSGLPYDNKGLVAPACHLLVAEALAVRSGVESALWELLMPYMEMAWSNPAEGGHGALGYNHSARDQVEFWSRTGLFAMAAMLRGDRPDMSDAMIRVMRERHPWLRNSHAYGEPGGALGLLALNLADGPVFMEILREYAWWFSLAWEPGHGLRFTQPHMGAPYMGEEDLINAAYALVLQANRRNLQITGAGGSDAR